ncbi:TetR/AcrR family transcriptional regulator [Gordonia paraffinivorans]|uniref:TetR/AcrR family transcriptional regulator n=1 Tax=Gordonia paraffinivorans TaxID=175628 RepID=UPI001E4097D8|nr:TetR family transcriptional regulator [Gordonia paraffinivorans]MCD2147409.1 TetR family transcriptional regulator [Gordonia paraffinivorans]
MSPSASNDVAKSAPLGSVREAQKQLTRQRLITAARAAFERNGFAGTSVRDITAAAEVNRATFYLHYEDKTQIFLDVLKQVLDVETASFWRTLDGALVEGSLESIRSWLDVAMVWYLDHSAFVNAWNEAMLVDSAVSQNWRASMDRLEAQLSGYLSQFPEADRVRARLVVEFNVILLSQVTMKHMDGGIPLDRRELLDILAGMWHRGLAVEK